MAYDLQYSSPMGRLTVRAGPEGITALVLEGQRFEAEHLSATAESCAEETAQAVLGEVSRWLDDYFAGKTPDPSLLPLIPDGTAFQKKVWRALLDIPSGETVTYGALANRVGSSPRAVGGAVGRNPIGILIPCHRVVGADGSLTGYAGGLAAKRWLLTHEGVSLEGEKDRLALREVQEKRKE